MGRTEVVQWSCDRCNYGAANNDYHKLPPGWRFVYYGMKPDRVEYTICSICGDIFDKKVTEFLRPKSERHG